MQAETLLSNIFSDLILMEAFKTMFWIFWFQGHYLSCKSMVVVHVSDMFACKDHIVSNALKRESWLSFSESVTLTHAPNCEEGSFVETWIESWASLAPSAMQKMYCAVIARSYHSFCLVFRFLFGSGAPSCVISLLNNCLWQSPDAAVQVSTAALCQESSLKMIILEVNRL